MERKARERLCSGACQSFLAKVCGSIQVPKTSSVGIHIPSSKTWFQCTFTAKAIWIYSSMKKPALRLPRGMQRELRNEDQAQDLSQDSLAALALVFPIVFKNKGNSTDKRFVRLCGDLKTTAKHRCPAVLRLKVHLVTVGETHDGEVKRTMSPSPTSTRWARLLKSHGHAVQLPSTGYVCSRASDLFLCLTILS